MNEQSTQFEERLRRARTSCAVIAIAGTIAGLTLLGHSTSGAWLVFLGTFGLLATVGSYHASIVGHAFRSYWREHDQSSPPGSHSLNFPLTADISLLGPEAQCHQQWARAASWAAMAVIVAGAAASAIGIG